MRFIAKWVVYCVIFMAILLVFAPKTNLYYQAEVLLKPYGVIVSSEEPSDFGIGFALKNAELYYEDLKVGSFDEAALLPLLLYNRVGIESFSFSNEMRNVIEGTVEHAVLVYTPLMPFRVSLEGSGDLGDFNGTLNLKERSVTIDLSASEALLKRSPFWLKKLKKTDEGVYRYATRY